MASYRLTYFDVDGGRGEPIRIALHAAGIDFEDRRIAFADFQEIRKDVRFTCLPVLEIDGKAFTQSNAIGRYIGKMAGLYPTDDLQALYCDEVVGAMEDLANQVGKTFFLQGDELRLAREKLVDGWLTVYIKGLDELLARGGGEYFADHRLTIADLKVFVQTRRLQSGALDYVPADLVDRLAPALAAHRERVESHPVVTAWYAKRERT